MQRTPSSLLQGTGDTHWQYRLFTTLDFECKAIRQAFGQGRDKISQILLDIFFFENKSDGKNASPGGSFSRSSPFCRSRAILGGTPVCPRWILGASRGRLVRLGFVKIAAGGFVFPRKNECLFVPSVHLFKQTLRVRFICSKSQFLQALEADHLFNKPSFNAYVQGKESDSAG